MTTKRDISIVTAALLLALSGGVAAQGGGAAGAAPAPAPPTTARTAAPIDLTGYWVAIISEDWRWRMVTPARGDYASIPLNPAGQRIADAWDPARDEAAGEQCRGYGAPGLMRGPTRLRLTWQDDETLKVEADYGMQTRLLRFRTPAKPDTAQPTWQGQSVAQWVVPAAGRGGATAPRFGSMKTVTTRLRPGYLRKNGVPYSANTAFTEYWDVHKLPNGDRYMVVTNVVDDPANLQIPWITSLHFKNEPDGSKWDPTPCSARF